jgi:hypothetical protein
MRELAVARRSSDTTVRPPRAPIDEGGDMSIRSLAIQFDLGDPDAVRVAHGCRLGTVPGTTKSLLPAGLLAVAVVWPSGRPPSEDLVLLHAVRCFARGG